MPLKHVLMELQMLEVAIREEVDRQLPGLPLPRTDERDYNTKAVEAAQRDLDRRDAFQNKLHAASSLYLALIVQEEARELRGTLRDINQAIMGGMPR